jgi:hypothetical protein
VESEITAKEVRVKGAGPNKHLNFKGLAEKGDSK